MASPCRSDVRGDRLASWRGHATLLVLGGEGSETFRHTGAAEHPYSRLHLSTGEMIRPESSRDQVSRVRAPLSALGKPPSSPVRSWAATSLRRTPPPSHPAKAAWRRR